jgi:hypothetical protein
VKFLLAKRVFWGATVSNFRYFRMSAASDLYCMLMAEFLVAAKGTLRARQLIVCFCFHFKPAFRGCMIAIHGIDSEKATALFLIVSSRLNLTKRLQCNRTAM